MMWKGISAPAIAGVAGPLFVTVNAALVRTPARTVNDDEATLIPVPESTNVSDA